MPTFRQLPPALRFVLVAVLVNVAVFAAFRLAFWATFQGVAPAATAADVARGLYLGFKFDLRLALLLGLPPLLFGLWPPLSPARRPAMRRVWLGYFVAVQAFVLFLYFVDFGHYDYVHVRLNASVLEHLEPVSVAAQMVWETYPIIPGLLALAALAAAYGWLLRRVAAPQLTVAAPAGAKWTARALVLAVTVAYALGMYGKWSWYPLRWSDAYFSGDGFVAALALNPVLFLGDTLGGARQRYDQRKVEQHYDYVAERLEVKVRDPRHLSFARTVTPAARAPARPNLVVIHLESFAGFKTGVFGNALKATPNFDALARDGILFSNFFVPAVPTARSVFNMLTGLPDYNPGQSASRNPLLVNQHTLVTALEDYERFYFLGGSATWGNIRGILSHNIPGLQVFEEGSYDAERPDAWGVSDLALFEKAHAVLADTRKPFFAFIQTSGNHRPYGIPAERRGFELATLDNGTLRKNGFDGLAAYNGLRFFDHALGHFFQLARSAPYFRNTLFVMYGDHGNPAANDIPWERLGLTGIHVPFVLYAPGWVKGGRVIDSAASQLDLLPTALSLMGVPHVNTTLGRDLLVERPRREHFALTLDGILDDEFLLRSNPVGGYRLYRYRGNEPTHDVSKEYPQRVAELAQLREALSETARYLLYHNPPQPHLPAKSP